MAQPNQPKQQPKPSLAAAMYPSLDPQAKALDKASARDLARQREREAMLQNAIEAGIKMQQRAGKR